jgi:hypothetical protein
MTRLDEWSSEALDEFEEFDELEVLEYSRVHGLTASSRRAYRTCSM